jgi:plasmid maintenance system antidote protein VapI
MARTTKQVEHEIEDEDFVTTELAHKLDGMIRDAADELQDTAHSFDQHWADLKELVTQAKTGEIYTLLDFDSWTDYLVDAVGLSLDGSNIDERRVLVAFLVSEGLSTRAMAKMLHVSQKTVDRDVHLLGAIEADVTGLDGKTYARGKSTAKKQDRPAVPPELRYTKVFNAASEDISRMIDKIDNDSEIACAAAAELEHIIEMRESLTKLITRLRRVLKAGES